MNYQSAGILAESKEECFPKKVKETWREVPIVAWSLGRKVGVAQVYGPVDQVDLVKNVLVFANLPEEIIAVQPWLLAPNSATNPFEFRPVSKVIVRAILNLSFQ